MLFSLFTAPATRGLTQRHNYMIALGDVYFARFDCGDYRWYGWFIKFGCVFAL